MSLKKCTRSGPRFGLKLGYVVLGFEADRKRLLETGMYTPSDRERLVRRAALALFPVFSRFEPDDSSPSDRKGKTENLWRFTDFVILDSYAALLLLNEFERAVSIIAL